MNTVLQRCAVHKYTIQCAQQCGQNFVNHTLHRSTLYHYKPYLWQTQIEIKDYSVYTCLPLYD